MKKIIKNEKGAVLLFVVAVISIIISFVSTLSLLSMVRTDHLQTQYQNDMIQEELFLRSESVRTERITQEIIGNFQENHTHEIFTPDRVTTYKITNVYERTSTDIETVVKSLITAKRARSFVFAENVPIKRYTVQVLTKKPLSRFQYITEHEKSENSHLGDDIVKFWGPDVLNGPVHSNDDIWIQNGGGGPNSGWPTFNDLVTTSGHILKWPDGTGIWSLPTELIFHGLPDPGYIEEVEEEIFTPSAIDIQTYGMRPFSYGVNRVVYVKISGALFSSYYRDLNIETEEFKVYSWYPADAEQANAVIAAGGNWFEDADEIWINNIDVSDTTWSIGPSGTVNNQSVYVENELWIEGSVAGMQTWCSAENVYIVGDITYAGTIPGNPPAQVVNGNCVENNTTDIFGLVSEKKIFIRYKHYDPWIEEIRDDNCNDIYLYGAYAAIGEGDPAIHGNNACHYDGIFTFEYQHPHGSTPNFEAPSPYISAEYTITLFDAGGDGWDDSSLDVIVEGETVFNDITCYGSENTYTFTVENGDIIETEYTPSGYANENEHTYEIYNQNGILVASDGPAPGPGITYQVFLPPGEDSLYTFIDYHKFIYPPSGYVPPNILGFELHGGNPGPCLYGMCGYPTEGFFPPPADPNGYVVSYPNNGPGYIYPYGTDYPHYNPIWPESAETIVTERGAIRNYGAIAQRRRGFVHRSGGDLLNHPNDIEWDLENWHYDGRHPSTGYAKDYHYDCRFLTKAPPDFPQLYEDWGQGAYSTSLHRKFWYFKSPPTN